MIKLRNNYYILRHGRTIYQTRKKKVSYSRESRFTLPLTKTGEKQAREAARKLKKIGIDLIFSSDFLRTRQTAKIVAKKLKIKKINFDKRLRDFNLGIYHNRPKNEIHRAFPDRKKRFSQVFPGGESWFGCRKRVFSFLKKVDKKYKGRKILFISHGDTLWLLEGAVKNWSIDKMLAQKPDNYIKTGELRKL